MSDNKQPENSSAIPAKTPFDADAGQAQLRTALALRAAEIRKELLAQQPVHGRWKLPVLSVQPIAVVRRVAEAMPRLNSLFLWIVVVPTLLAILYFGVIASDIYVCESSFMVRAPQTQSASLGALSLLQGTGLLTSDHDDTYAVEDYITSLGAVRALDLQLDLKKRFGDKHVDFLRRFGGAFPDASDEGLLRYYQWWIVDVGVESSSSIATLTVRAFRPEDAFRINSTLLNLGEDLVNKMNERARQDLVGYAQRDLDLAEQRAKNARSALSAYRDVHNVLDPEHQGGLQLEENAKLQSDLVATKATLAELESVAPQNPQIEPLKKHIQTVDAAIRAQNLDVAGDHSSLAHKAAEYDTVALQRSFADEEVARAQAVLQQAEREALDKQLYLERVVEPTLPTAAWEPRRFKDIVATFLLGAVLWMVLGLLINGVREHGD